MLTITCNCGNKYPKHQYAGGLCVNCGRVLGLKEKAEPKPIGLKQITIFTIVAHLVLIINNAIFIYEPGYIAEDDGYLYTLEDLKYQN